MVRLTQPYKRSFSSSLGSGMGSVFGNSGRQYYILEHKSGSKYHRAGESQEIIVDQIEIGRDPKCQVRFDESFTTVSRRHAAIVRSGDKWKLIQLSTTNPTFLNGSKVGNEWYLQNGDEIQLSVGGPKLSFLLPSGGKSSVGSLGLTRRLSLFRRQALQPYKKAIMALSIALVLLLAGTVGWGIYSHQKQANLMAENTRIGGDLETLTQRAEKLSTEAGQSKEEMEALRKEADALAEELQQNNEQSAQSQKEMNNLQRQLYNVTARVAAASAGGGNATPASRSGNNDNTGSDAAAGDSGNEAGTAAANRIEPGANENVSGRGVASASEVNRLSPYVYAITLDKIETNYKKRKFIRQRILPQVVGTGFILSDGRFVTARHVVEPWYFYNFVKDYEVLKESDLREYNFFANNGGTVTFHFSAISSTGKKFTFSSNLARVNRTSDRVESEKYHGGRVVVRKAVVDDTDWAVFQTLETTGFNFNYSLSNNLQTGAELEILGFPYGKGAEGIQITPIYSTSNVARQGLDVNGTILVSNDNTGRGNAGGPVLTVNNGAYQIVGIMSGSTFAKGRIVPISVVQ